jgi:hypothetical protein
MLQAIEAVVDEEGNVHLLSPVRLSVARRAIVTILDEQWISRVPETALLSEAALAEDWNRPEEEAAWSHLQSGRSGGSTTGA